MRWIFRRPILLGAAWLCAAACLSMVSIADAQIVPGTGRLLTETGDDFEDEEWSFVHNHPKGSKEQDKSLRYPSGFSSNKRWIEGPMRGQPDLIKRVETPEGGLPGSEGALLLRTLNSGVPGYANGGAEQDDFVLHNSTGSIYVSRYPSCVTRVYLPPFEQWERRAGVSFGYRAGAHGRYYGPTKKDKEGKKIRSGDLEEFWPGMFIRFNPGTKDKADSATLLIRANNRGFDVEGPTIKETGWWTLGMSFTPDGQIHYYAHAGVAPLSSADYLYSSRPYALQCERFSTVFFNVVNRNDGRTWSTPWVVDDTEIYIGSAPVARKP